MTSLGLDGPQLRRRLPVNTVALALSLLAHAGLVLVAAVAITRTLPPSSIRSIEVEIVNAPITPPAAAAAPPPELATTGDAAAAAEAVPAAEAETGEIHASRLLAESILATPQNRQVRNALPTLAPFERMVQLCDIEAVEQVRLANPAAHPDTVEAASFADAQIVDGVLVAAGAAYRSDRQWYHMTFRCTPRGDLLAVADFSLTLGEPIPEAEWDAHNLIAEDVED